MAGLAAAYWPNTTLTGAPKVHATIAVWLTLPLVIVILLVDRVAGQSFGSSMLDFLVAGAACGAIGAWVHRRKV